MLTQAPKGTRDILPSDIHKWHYLENVIREICNSYGYGEIRIPVFEHTELYRRGVGETTDIVQKEMYTFDDKGGRSITLRPEGTAGVIRSYIEHKMGSLAQPVKMYYMITVYRFEKPQAGRYREHRQFGVEAVGASGPEIDTEIISMLDMLFKRLGIKGLRLNINSNGCPVCRSGYNKLLKDFLETRLKGLCGTCIQRFEKNPFRILDCKIEACRKLVRDVPALTDNLCDECGEHFKGFMKGLDNLGIKYEVNKNIVRGLDYYTKTVFEYISDDIGAQGTVAGGGRYDGLVEECGGAPTPGIGFGLGMDRILLVMENQKIKIPEPFGTTLFIATVGENSNNYAQKLVYSLREAGINAEKDLMGRSLKAQMRHADRLGARYSMVIGDDEIASGKVVLKDMTSGEQREILLEKVIEEFVSSCKRGEMIWANQCKE